MENLANHLIKKLLIGALALLAIMPAVAFAARTSVDWVNLSGTSYIQPNFGAAGIDLLIYGSNRYVNFNTVTGSSGYGLRDNAGTIEFKNSGGSWASIGSGGGSSFGYPFLNNATTTQLNFSGGASTTLLSVFTKAYFGGTSTSTIDSVGNIFDAGTFTISTSTSGCASFSGTGLLYSTGTACGTGGGASFGYPFLGNATSTTLYFNNGLVSTASSTFNNSVYFTNRTSPNLAYFGTSGSLFDVATSSETCTSASGISCGAFNIVGSGGALSLSAIPNASLSNSTISGVALGNALNSLSHDSTLSGTSYNGSASVSNWGLNLGSTNIWTAQQTFNAQTNMLGPLVIGTSTASTTIWGATATSTFASGINLTTGGCFAIAGACLTAGSVGGGSTEAVNWATAAVLGGTPVYANGTAGVGATLTEVGAGALSVDSNNPAVGDRVLVKTQASAFQNGIYGVTVAGSGIASYVLTRVTDYNAPTEITPGITTYVLSGTVNTDTTWAVSYTPPLTIGTNNLVYIQTAGQGGTVTSVTATYPLASTGGATPVISTAFGTTTTWGMGNNGLVMTGATGIPFVQATSSAVALSVTGNAGTATALAANGTNCSAGSAPLGVDASGNSEGCFAVQASGTYLTALGSGWASTTLSSITFSTTTLTVNGLTYGMTVVPANGSLTFTPTVSGTYNGQAGSVANALTINNSGTGAASASTYNGSAAVTLSFNSIGAISTTSPWTIGQLAYVNSNQLVTSVATGTISAGSSAITVTAGRSAVGGALAIDCAAAGTSQNGCLSSTDWNTFNGKSGFAYPFSLNGYGTTTGLGIFGSTTIGNGTVPGGLTVSGTATTSNLIDTSITSALALFDANHKQTAYAGSAPCSAGQVALSLSATGVITCTAASTFGYPFTVGTFGLSQSAGTSTTVFFPSLLAAGSSTIGSIVATSSITNVSVKSALVLNGSGGLEGAYAGSAPCSATQAALSLSAAGVISCTAVSTFSYPFTVGNVFGNAAANSTSTLSQFTGGLIASSSLLVASSTGSQIILDDALQGNRLQLRNIGGNFFIGTSTFSSNATSTFAALSLSKNGQLYTSELSVATSTAMTVDWLTTPNQVDVQVGTAAITIGFNNASTTGMTKRIVICNSASAASTITWSVGNANTALLWSGGTVPVQTTTASKCDIYSFITSQATSTSNTTLKIFGGYNQNY